MTKSYDIVKQTQGYVMSLPIIAVGNLPTPAPPWFETAQAQLRDTYQLHLYTEHAGYVTRLADEQVALILVHGEGDWIFWTATPKSSPATRRIPVILIADLLPPNALTSGADLALTPDDFMQNLTTLVSDLARVPDPERLAQLDCECLEPLPDLAVQGVEKFNAGEFYKQHDLFEELWMQTEGPVRDLYRAILQVGVAYYQIERGNHRGAVKMLLRSVQWLAVLPDVCQGINVKALREDSYRVRAALEGLHEEEIAQFDRSLLQPVKRVDV